MLLVCCVLMGMKASGVDKYSCVWDGCFESSGYSTQFSSIFCCSF